MKPSMSPSKSCIVYNANGLSANIWNGSTAYGRNGSTANNKNGSNTNNKNGSNFENCLFWESFGKTADISIEGRRKMYSTLY